MFDGAPRKPEAEERSNRVCIVKDLRAVRRDPLLRGADPMKTSIFSRAVLKGTMRTAKAVAVRATVQAPKQRWDHYGF